ncbi:hypothetical protein [Leptospira kirschneri]|uniref:hypothetical protein n=1 Tax=Leptospira kirschneri TaxID=29507 RepID=UPI0002F63010|nr:hypothetical protein [Leptospira kirschneri]
MQKLNLICSLIGLCFFSVNCLYSVKPNYTIERFESATRPKAEMGPESLGGPALRETLKKNFSKFIDLTEYSEVDKDRLRIVIQEYSPRDEENSYGKIGYFNLCILIPCWNSYKSGVKVEYEINGKTERVERYTENKTLWVWLPFVFYNILTFSSEKEDYDKTDYLNLLNNIAPNIAKSTLKIENENKSRIAEQAERLLQKQKEVSEWEKVNKNSVRDLVHYLQNANEGELKDQAKEFFHNLLDKKVQTYLERQFPFVKPYLMNDLIYSDGSASNYKFYQVFRDFILGRNPETGLKPETQLSQKDGKIVWRIDTPKEIYFFYFSPYKKNITLEKIVSEKNGYEETSNSLETYLIGKSVFDMFSAYPTHNSTDIEFLEKVK